ncbi:hypothetical protein GCM10027417_24850 [Glutamicibacter endophyticus]|uniref:mycothiol transferase n=1 Tax=Glutamicibacter sp. PS TaxID=3075634 RepID=UPI0028443723|nr:DUF664 domain-containing protein [Glutamicibacter sp. PS]MDR4534978.1 DinB family protein [Glutamicibacter sp. PS]
MHTEIPDLLDALGDSRSLLREAYADLDEQEFTRRSHPEAPSLQDPLRLAIELELGWCALITHGERAQDTKPSVATSSSITAALQQYASVAAATDALISSLTVFDRRLSVPPTPWTPPGSTWSLRRVIAHLITQTAFQAGQAQTLRTGLAAAASGS